MSDLRIVIHDTVSTPVEPDLEITLTVEDSQGGVYDVLHVSTDGITAAVEDTSTNFGLLPIE